MTDTPPSQPSSEGAAPLRPASPVRRTAARAARAGVSLIWLVPVIALLVTLGLAWNAYSGRGTLISVAFTDAAGITPGETQLRFREIAVGQVEAVRFTGDLRSVLVDIRVAEDVAQFIDDDAEFWIVRPQVSTQGISRLDTVLTGAFIEGSWDDEPGPAGEEIHVGLDKPPLTRSNEQGTWVTLASDSAKGLSEGAPVFFRGLTVGRMQNLRLSERDETVLADVFVSSPHDQRLTTATVFWDISGFSVGLGPQGVELNVTAVTSLLQGGVEFATLISGGQPIRSGHVYQLQPDQEAAQNSLFSGAPQSELRLSLLLPEAIKGLTEGAPVQFQGLNVGRVTNLAVRLVPAGAGQSRQVLQDITIAISPQRLGLRDEATAADALSFLAGRVAEGLRARVAGAGLLGTSLMIELVEVPEAPAAQIVTDAEPHPIMPVAPADMSDISTSAQGLLNRLGNLELEELLTSATDMMDSVTALARSQDTRAIPEALRRTIDEARVTMTDLRSTAAELRQSGAVGNIAAAAEAASALAGKLNTAADQIPSIVDSLDTATASAAQVDFAALAADAQAALTDLRGVIGTEAARALPGRLAAAVDSLGSASADIGALAGELRQGGASGKLTQALDEAAAAFQSLDAAATSAAQVDLAALAADAQGALTDLRSVVGTEEARTLPGRFASAVDSLGSASAEIGTLATELSQAGASAKLTQALDEASAAFQAVEEAAVDVPEMVDRVDEAAVSIDEFDFAGVSAETKGLVADLRAMLGTEDAEQLPRNLSDTLEAASGLLNDLRDGNAAGSLNAALDSARRAMDQIASAANTLPALSQRFQQLAARGEGVIAAYGDRGAFQTELINTLRSLRRAAESFGSLSATIERNPRAFILGR